MGGCFSDVKGGKQAVGGVPMPLNPSGETPVNEAVDHFLRSKGYHSMFTQLELSLSACGLRDRDIMSKSDPMVVVYTKKRDGTLDELGRTEVIMNSLNPAWISKIAVAFHFEFVQPLLFQVYDVDTKYFNLPVKMLNLNHQDFLGEGSCVLSEIVTKQDLSLTLDLQHKNGIGGWKNLGKLTVRAEETIASRNAIEVIFRCSQLENKDLFAKSDPFLRISRFVEHGGSVPICKTEVVDKNLNPIWRPLSLTMLQFVTKDSPLVIECFDFNISGNHVLIGKLQKSMSSLEQLHKQKMGAKFVLPSSIRPSHEKVLKSQLFVDHFCEKQLYSFLDYISSGFELNFMVAVDFTGSNRNPKRPDSLHYIDPHGRFNVYQEAIKEVGEVLQFYDYDKRFPAWGFGGQTRAGTVSHCFNLNGSASNAEVEGVQGIMAAYSRALNEVKLSGPTLFGPVINNAAEIASQSLFSSSHKYFVLLIITDGVLTDLQEATNAIVRASDLPLSLMIVGVGQADFKQMEILDADNGCRLQSSSGRIATRDIVQFVPMRKVLGVEETSVIEALLEELPGQFLTFMRSRDIKPIAVSI